MQNVTVQPTFVTLQIKSYLAHMCRDELGAFVHLSALGRLSDLSFACDCLLHLNGHRLPVNGHLRESAQDHLTLMHEFNGFICLPALLCHVTRQLVTVYGVCTHICICW